MLGKRGVYGHLGEGAVYGATVQCRMYAIMTVQGRAVQGFGRDEWTQRYIDLRFRAGNFNDHIEFKGMREVLPDVKGLDVLDLGCGPGVLCEYLSQAGAKAVIGVDISKPLVKYAEKNKKKFNIRYICDDMRNFLERGGRFGLVVSSLAIHFVPDLGQILGLVYRALPDHGRFVFSVRHPVRSGNPTGEHWAFGQCSWLQNKYGLSGQRTHNWLGQELRIFHRTFERIFSDAISNGFEVVELKEPLPTSADVRRYSNLREALDSPPFLVISLKKRAE